LKNEYDYLPFGGPYAPGTSVTVIQRYTYTGREANPAGPLMYYRYRTYDARVGRFPLREWMLDNRRLPVETYPYAENRPTAKVDPFGLATVTTGTMSAKAVARIDTIVLSNNNRADGYCGKLTISGKVDADPRNVQGGNVEQPGTPGALPPSAIGVSVSFIFIGKNLADPKCCCDEFGWKQSVSSTKEQQWHLDTNDPDGWYGGSQTFGLATEMSDYPGGNWYATDDDGKYLFYAISRVECKEGLNKGQIYADVRWRIDMVWNDGPGVGSATDTVDYDFSMTGTVYK
jgi:RHS repeat-associated protein